MHGVAALVDREPLTIWPFTDGQRADGSSVRMLTY
jgi:hypothetical protein